MGCFVILILKCFIFCDRQAKEFGVLSICFVLDRKVRGSIILVEANFFLAIKLQSDLIFQGILKVASTSTGKNFKVEIKPKILLQTRHITMSNRSGKGFWKNNVSTYEYFYQKHLVYIS